MANPKTEPKPAPRAITLDEVQRYAMDSAVEKAQAAQQVVNVIASKIAVSAGWPENTRVNYTDGKLVEVVQGE